MTPVEGKLAIGALAALWLWLRGRRRPPASSPTGNVDIGTPTVSGSGSDQYGGQDYSTTPLAPNSEMQRLIEESTRAILENGGYPE